MDYKRTGLALGAQLGVFAMGGLGWLAATRGLYASAVLCGLTGIALASLGLTTTAFRIGRDLLRRNLQPGAIFTAELSRRRLQVLLDQTPSPLLLQPENGQLIAVNRAARNLFEVSYALPITSRRLLLGDAEGLAGLPGQIKWKGNSFAVHLAEMEEDDRSSHLAVLTDISADVRAAEASALRDLLRVLNHELMNALTPVTSMSRSALELLGDDTPESRAQAVKALERVVARTDGLSNFINAYRALTRLPPPQIRPVVVSQWLEVITESFAAQWEEKGVRFILEAPAVEAPETDLSALIDEDQMWLCVGNLLNNGAQAALEKPDPCVRLSLVPNDGALRIRVEDSGKGIAPDQADQIFLPFYTTKETGTGVGLSLARQIVQGHGSLLSLAPTLGMTDALGGACFQFSWRLAT
jgi:two-component system, NtrC family, nitrogen regulation sensor histidine kinase NtrY